jgi:hypothetical protein
MLRLNKDCARPGYFEVRHCVQYSPATVWWPLRYDCAASLFLVECTIRREGVWVSTLIPALEGCSNVESSVSVKHKNATVTVASELTKQDKCCASAVVSQSNRGESVRSTSVRSKRQGNQKGGRDRR